MNKNGNTKNLKPFTSETARAAALKGVEKRKENIAKRKAMKETLDILMTKAMKKGKMVYADDIASIAEASNKNVDAQTAMLVAVVQRAQMGDVQAIQFIRDTIGEKPTDKVEVDSSKTIEAWAKSHKMKL